ncbi:MAG: methionyl-tRNA formyltransferase [Bacteroidales bacterium]|jgi:methionyl-tRNA formyltransferase|nr:methionyl-tRNA formyltransferase [Bacteroidales bacterium]
MRIVFMGTPEFAVASLEALIESGNEVAAVVTSPDKPAGRGQKMQEPAVKQCAVRHGVPVLQPEKLKDPAFLEALHSLRAELFVVVAFRMLPEEVWKMPPSGTINLHASLLPQYRGAAPINWAVINGETRSGTTVFFINREIDKGNIISYREEAIHPDDSAGMLHDRLMLSGAAHLAESVSAIASGNYKTLPQDNALQNQPLKGAPKIFRETCKIDWNHDVVQLHNFVRGLSPYPAAWTTLVSPKGGRLTLKIYETAVQPDSASPAPGTIDSDSKTYLRVAANGGWLAIRSLRLEGKKRMETPDFLRGIHQLNMDEYRIFASSHIPT